MPAKTKKHHLAGKPSNARKGSDARSKSVIIRCTPEEHAALVNAAKEIDGGKLSDYIRQHVPVLMYSQV